MGPTTVKQNEPISIEEVVETPAEATETVPETPTLSPEEMKKLTNFWRTMSLLKGFSPPTKNKGTVAKHHGNIIRQRRKMARTSRKLNRR